MRVLSSRITGFFAPLIADLCSDITNDQLGISGETDAVVRISMFIICTVLSSSGLNSQLVCHTTLLPHQGGLASAN